MEPTKIQSSTLFTYSKVDFRDKLEEVSENWRFLTPIRIFSQPYFFDRSAGNF